MLNLDNNGLGYVYTDAFDSVPALLSLSLSHNVIGFLPDNVFSALQILRDLRLANNRLTHVWSGTLAGLAQLARLSLAGNLLVHLPVGVFRHAPVLRHICLDDNHLTTLDRCSVLQVPPGSSSSTLLRTLSFVGNAAIACDCRLSWVMTLQTAVTRPTAVWGACPGSLQSIMEVVANDTDQCETSNRDVCVEWQPETFNEVIWSQSVFLAHKTTSEGRGYKIYIILLLPSLWWIKLGIKQQSHGKFRYFSNGRNISITFPKLSEKVSVNILRAFP